jgi:hypothetical protein
MKIVLTEHQYEKLLLESSKSIIGDEIKRSKEFIKKIVRSVKEDTKLDFSFLFTWGAAIGGFSRPVFNYFEGKHPELTHQDLALLTIACAVTYYTSNREKLSKLLDVIKDRGLVKYFNEMLEKTDELKNTFLSFVDSLRLTGHKISGMLAYTFIIPFLSKLLDMSGGATHEDIIMLSKIIIGYLAVKLSSATLSELLSKIIKRFRS